MFGQEVGLLDVQAFHEPAADIERFLDKSADRQMTPVSAAGYMGYIAPMGLVMAIGAVRPLRNQSLGLPLIGAFIAMYALLFANFQTINPKAIHLAVCLVLFGVLLWLKRAQRNAA